MLFRSDFGRSLDDESFGGGSSDQNALDRRPVPGLHRDQHVRTGPGEARLWLDLPGAVRCAEEYALDMIIENYSDAERTEWYPMETNPVRIGYYEIRVKGYDENHYETYAKFDGVWDFYNVESLTGWRGLTENHND